MYITKWNNHPVLNSIFDRFVNIDKSVETDSKSCYKPATNIVESDNAFEMDIAIPGLKKEDVKKLLN